MTPRSDLAAESGPVIDAIRRDLEATAGMVVDVDVYWVTPEEEAEREAEAYRSFEEAQADPEWTVITIGSGPALPGTRELTGFWELSLPNQRSMIHDIDDVVDVIQEYVIMQLWGDGRSASWPECPVHGGHPLQAVVREPAWYWQCPREGSVVAALGKLGRS